MSPPPATTLTPELEWLRRSVERDRYGLMAYVLLVRDHCTPSDCAAFRSLTDHRQIVSNMDERIYDGLIVRYSGSWGAPAAAAAPALAAAAADDAHGQTHQCGFPDRGLDAAGQHHDAGTGDGAAGILAPAGSDRDRAAAVTAPADDDAAAAPTAAKKPARRIGPRADPACARAEVSDRCRSGGR